MLTLSKQLFFVRGMAIFFVVVGHVIGGRSGGVRQLYSQDVDSLRSVYDFIYTFHMPLFFLLSGMGFVLFSKPESVQEFVKNKVLRLLLPMVAWSPAYYLLRAATGSEKLSLSNLLDSIISPEFIFWFFPAILFCLVLSFLFVRIVDSQFLYSLVSVGLFGLSYQLEATLSIWFYFNIFYAIGVALGPYLSADSQVSGKQGYRPAIVAIAIVIAMILIFQSFGLNTTTKFINGLLGFCAILSIAQVLPFNKITHAIMQLGQLSMPIYLMHVLFGVVARIVLLKFNITHLGIHLGVGVIASLLIPILVHQYFSQNFFYRVLVGEKGTSKRKLSEA